MRILTFPLNDSRTPILESRNLTFSNYYFYAGSMFYCPYQNPQNTGQMRWF